MAKDPFTATFGHILELTEKKEYFSIELSINKIIEPYNSWLIFQYAQLDSRFRMLAIVLKLWNKKFFTNKFQRLNSYSLTLMLLAYLQKKEILPSISKLSSGEGK